jgi:hypothetical protein
MKNISRKKQNMKTLYLHVGYHKTATSLLQRKVFPRIGLDYEAYPEIGSITNYKSHNPKIHPMGNSIRMMRLFNCSPKVWKSNIGEKILKKLIGKKSNKKDVLLSDEDFLGDIKSPTKYLPAENIVDSIKGEYNLRWIPSSGYCKRGNDPTKFAKHIEEIKKSSRKMGVKEVKIIVGIRRQDTLLVSLYSQMSDRTWGASQKGMKEWVSQITSESLDYYHNGGSHLNFYETIKEISKVVGKKRVLILPLEDLKTEPKSYMENLVSFLGRSTSNTENITDGIKNKKSKTNKRTEKSWRLKNLRSMYLSYSKKDKNNGEKKGAWRLPIRFIDRCREKEIVLTKEISEKIIRKYSESNKRLDNYIENLRLGGHSYY